MSNTQAEPIAYEIRTLGFLDVLGTKEFIKASVSDPGLIAKMEDALTSTDFVPALRDPSYMPMSVFSDHVCISVLGSGPAEVAELCAYLKGVALNFLKKGFCVRGAIVEGKLIHRSNRIFGPALLEAIEIEGRVAGYPRIVFSEAVTHHLMVAKIKAGGDLRLRDQDGLQYLDVLGWTNLSERCSQIGAALKARWPAPPADLNIRAKLAWMTRYLAFKQEQEVADTYGRQT